MMSFEAALDRAQLAAWDRDPGNATWCGLYEVAGAGGPALLAHRRVPPAEREAMVAELRARGIRIGSTYRISGVLWAIDPFRATIWDAGGLRFDAAAPRPDAATVVSFVDPGSPGHRGVRLQLADGREDLVLEEFDDAAEADPTYGAANLAIDAGWTVLVGRELARFLGAVHRDELNGRTTPAAPVVASTLSALRSECECCGAWSSFTGRTEQYGSQTYAILRCPNGHGEFPVWNRDREPLLAAAVRARAWVTDPAAYDRAFATLTGGDSEAIRALAEGPPPELPLFSIEEVALPATAAARWCELLLDWHGWRPAPDPAVRIEEALAAAVRLGAPACVEAVAARVGKANLAPVLEKLGRRFYGSDMSVLDLPWLR